MHYLFIIILASLAIWVGHAAIALLLGITASSLITLPKGFITKKIGSRLLQIGIVFLGGSISVSSVVEVSGNYFPWISFFVILAFLLTLLLGKFLNVGQKQSYLLASGSAICGGTAIAAISPVIKPEPEEIVNALTIVFVLNALAVVVFPFIGTWLELSQEQFGVWAALAIHDTASVIGAASLIGDEAIQIAATLKLGRTLWIIPLVLFTAFYFREKGNLNSFPVFVLFFAFAVTLNWLLNPSEEINNILKQINRIFLLSGLFCIGTQIDYSAIKDIPLKVLLLALAVWAIIIPSSLWLAWI